MELPTPDLPDLDRLALLVVDVQNGFDDAKTAPMAHVRRFDHLGITVADLDRATAFFVGLGLDIEGRMFMDGEFADTVIGIPDSRSEIVMLRPPDGGACLELSSFVRPDHQPGSPAAMSTELGLRNVAFEVADLQAAVDRLGEDGYGLIGGVGQYEHVWRMAYVRRTGGNHRVPGRAHRLTPPPASQTACSCGGNPGCSTFQSKLTGERPECRTPRRPPSKAHRPLGAATSRNTRPVMFPDHLPHTGHR